MTARPYLVCDLPRSGGRLLASTLRATGAVAAPEPWFWSGWRGHDPGTARQLRCEPAGRGAAALYARIRSSGTGADGSFGAEVRWAELHHLVTALRGGEGSARCPGRAEHELLAGFLPGLRYVHLTREDKAAQAVACWRARLHDDRDVTADGPEPGAIEVLERQLLADEWRWVSFFTRAGVEPLVVSYEALNEDHAATVRRILDFVGVDGAGSVEVAEPGGPDADRVDRVDRARADLARQARRRAAGGPPGTRARVSVVITGHGPGDDVPAAVTAVRAQVAPEVEIVVVDDRPAPAPVDGALVACPPAPAGPAATRNFGAGRASGDVLVFLDAGTRPRPGWLPPLLDALAGPAVAVAGPAVLDGAGAAPTAFGLTWDDPLLRGRHLEQRPGRPVPVPFVPRGCMAFRRRDFEAVGGFDIGMLTAGAEDAEICLHLWRRGRRCLVVPAAEVVHDRPCPGAGAGDDRLHDTLRLATTHFGPDTLLRTFDQATGWEAFPEVYARLVHSDVFERRRQVVAGATHDETWFLDRFGIDALRGTRVGVAGEPRS